MPARCWPSHYSLDQYMHDSNDAGRWSNVAEYCQVPPERGDAAANCLNPQALLQRSVLIDSHSSGLRCRLRRNDDRSGIDLHRHASGRILVILLRAASHINHKCYSSVLRELARPHDLETRWTPIHTRALRLSEKTRVFVVIPINTFASSAHIRGRQHTRQSISFPRSPR